MACVCYLSGWPLTHLAVSLVTGDLHNLTPALAARRPQLLTRRGLFLQFIFKLRSAILDYRRSVKSFIEDCWVNSDCRKLRAMICTSRNAFARRATCNLLQIEFFCDSFILINWISFSIILSFFSFSTLMMFGYQYFLVTPFFRTSKRSEFRGIISNNDQINEEQTPSSSWK